MITETRIPKSFGNMEGEILSAMLSSLLISPMVAIVDKAIFSDASGKMDLKNSIAECAVLIFQNPRAFLRTPTFLWCWAVYAATYTVSNCTDRYARKNDKNASQMVLINTSVTNITMNLLKDNYLTRQFAILTPKRLPMASFLCYAMRDFITISGSFTLVQPVADVLRRNLGWGKKMSLLVSQFCCPIAGQLTNTPLFLYGIDLYNRPGANYKLRLKFIQDYYWKTYYWARLARVTPAYSIGGNVNHALRYLFTPQLPEIVQKSSKNK